MKQTTIGQLRTRAMLEKPVDVTDGAGGARRTWAVISEVWVALDSEVGRQGGGREQVREDRLGSATTGTITLRYRPDLAPDMRFRVGDRVFDIRAITDMSGHSDRIVCRVEEHPR